MNSSLKLGIFLARKNLSRRKAISLFVVVVIALGFLNVAFMTSFMDGFSNRLNDNLIEKQYGNILIDARGDNRYIDDAGALVDKLRRVPGVTGVARRYIIGSSIRTEDGDESVTPWMFQSIDITDERTVTDIHKDIIAGSFLTEGDSDSIVLGSGIAGVGQQLLLPEEDTLQARIGDRVVVAFENGKERIYKVKGVIDSRDFFASLSAYITQKEAEEILGLDDKASLIVVRVPAGEERAYVERFKRLGIKEDIKTWEVKASTTKIITQSFDLLNNIFGVVGVFIVFITIIIIVYINLLNNRRQIGIIKAVGVRPLTIVTTYTIMGAVYSVVGILVGSIVLLGLTTWFSSYPLDSFVGPVTLHINSVNYIMSIIIILIASVIGAALPAHKYTRQTIIRLIWS